MCNPICGHALAHLVFGYYFIGEGCFGRRDNKNQGRPGEESEASWLPARLVQTVVGGSVPKDIAVHRLSLKSSNFSRLNLGVTRAKDVNVENLTLKSVSLDQAGVKQLTLNHFNANGVHVQTMKASNVHLQEAGVKRLGLSDVDVQNISMKNLTASDVILNRAGVINLNLSHVALDDLKLHGLDLRGTANMKRIKLENVAARNISLDHAGLKDLALKRVHATSVGVRDMKASHVILQAIGVNQLGVRSVDAHNMSISHVAAKNIVLEKAGITNLDVSHVNTDGLNLHGIDLEGSAAMQSVKLGKFVLGDVEVGPIKHIGEEIQTFLLAAKVIVILAMFIMSLLCVHLWFVIVKDVKENFSVRNHETNKDQP